MVDGLVLALGLDAPIDVVMEPKQEQDPAPILPLPMVGTSVPVRVPSLRVATKPVVVELTA